MWGKRLLALKLSRSFSSRMSLAIDETTEKMFTEGMMKPKRHTGICNIKTVKLPQKIEQAVATIIKDNEFSEKVLVDEGDQLHRYLRARHPPVDDTELRVKAKQIYEKFYPEGVINYELLEDNEIRQLEKAQEQRVKRRLKREIYHWKAVEYSFYNNMLYIASRLAPNYAAITRVLTEINSRVTHFNPTSVFDFGSGCCTTAWAVNSLWRSSVNEYMCVDTSADSNEVAKLILSGGKPDNQPHIKPVYFRQFLPTTNERQYDIVVSTFSLLELPSTQNRLDTILTLWNKTIRFLVLIELGTSAAFKIIQEARDFILSTSDATVFSPCPHDLICPREEKKPCLTPVKYTPLYMSPQTTQMEVFSYVVLERIHNDISKEESSWPRCVDLVLRRKKHVVCKVCCSDGKFRETVITSSRQGKALYRCARKSNWGDLLPANAVFEEDSQS